MFGCLVNCKWVSPTRKEQQTINFREVYHQIRLKGLRPNISVILAALKACGRSKDLQTGQKIHADVMRDGDDLHIFVASTLVDMYAKCGNVVGATQIFEGMPHHDVVSWSCIILGFALKGEDELVLQFYQRMQGESFTPDSVIILAALKACIRLAEKEEGKEVQGRLLKTRYLDIGKAIHLDVVRYGQESNLFVTSTLVDMYARCGSMLEARLLFDSMMLRDVVTWTAIIMGYTQSGESQMALQFYARMHCEGCKADEVTFLVVLKACANLAETEETDTTEAQRQADKLVYLDRGRGIHKQLASAGYETNKSVACSLLDMYAKCGSMLEARWVFDRIRNHDVVSWTAAIMGYAENGEGELALELYVRMQHEGCSPNRVTFIASLKACGILGSLELGKRIHTHICYAGVEGDSGIRSSLVDFYGKCGSMVNAQKVFDLIEGSDVVTWNSLVTGYSRQGDTTRVFSSFDKMLKEKVKVNGVTFLALLTACSHAGLVDKGKEYFEAMLSLHMVKPKIDHYICMVDLLGRANHMDDALAMIRKMPFEPNFAIWMTLLSACAKWKNAYVGRLAFESVLRFDDRDASAYVLMREVNMRSWSSCCLQGLQFNMSSKVTVRAQVQQQQNVLSFLCPLLKLIGSGDPSAPRNVMFETATSGIASVARLPWGKSVNKQAALSRKSQPSQLFKLYEFEACPFCRRVREALTELDLSAEVYPCPKGSLKHRSYVREVGSKEQFPFFVDPNTGESMYESSEIVKYLFKTYGGGKSPSWGLLESTLLTGWVPTLVRAGRGMMLWNGAELNSPPKLLELYSYENNQFARVVREALCELELPYILWNTGIGSSTAATLLAISGSTKVPFLVDPNTGVKMNESMDIINYLFATYKAHNQADKQM